ncbi:hypothetical protein Tco_1127952 [Tanacetum coccineum]
MNDSRSCDQLAQDLARENNNECSSREEEEEEEEGEQQSGDDYSEEEEIAWNDDVLDVLGLVSRYKAKKVICRLMYCYGSLDDGNVVLFVWRSLQPPDTASQLPGWPPVSLQLPDWAGTSFGLSEVGFHYRFPKLRPLADAYALSLSKEECECLSYMIVKCLRQVE